jgi:hypothetical protein
MFYILSFLNILQDRGGGEEGGGKWKKEEKVKKEVERGEVSGYYVEISWKIMLSLCTFYQKSWLWVVHKL